MKILCEILLKSMNKTFQFNGPCFQCKDRNITIEIKPNQTAISLQQKNDFEAALFIIIVICFYSLSIVFIVITNTKFDILIDQDLDGSFYCWQKKKNDLYEAQKDETKSTIHFIFNDSSKLLTSVVITPDKYDKVINI